MRFRLFVNNAADHHIDDVVFCTVFCDERSHIAAVTHDSHSVCDYFDLIHTVGNIDDTQILFTEVADNLEKFADFRIRQSG